MFLLPDGRSISLDVPFNIGDTYYPANWLRLSSEAERLAIGITEVPEPLVYDQRFYWGYDADGNLIPKQLEDEPQVDAEGNPVLDPNGQPIITTGLKTLWKNTTSATANSLLTPTDWYIVRETDTGVPCPPSIRSWRQAVRDAATAKRDLIAACTSVEDLATYITSPGTIIVDPETGDTTLDTSNAYSTWPVQPAADSQTVLDYRAFYDALLISPAYATIRTKAINSAPVLTACVEFIAAIGDAKAGRPNPPAIQACVDLLCAASSFTPSELADLAAVMAVGGLDTVYTLPSA